MHAMEQQQKFFHVPANIQDFRVLENEPDDEQIYWVENPVEADSLSVRDCNSALDDLTEHLAEHGWESLTCPKNFDCLYGFVR